MAFGHLIGFCSNQHEKSLDGLEAGARIRLDFRKRRNQNESIDQNDDHGVQDEYAGDTSDYCWHCMGEHPRRHGKVEGVVK